MSNNNGSGSAIVYDHVNNKKEEFVSPEIVIQEDM